MKRLAQDVAMAINQEAENYPDYLVPVKGKWPDYGYDLYGIIEIWSSKRFRVLIFKHKDGTERLSIHRMEVDVNTGTWTGSVTWDEIQDLKRQCGRGNKRFAESFPPDEEIINNANIRHLWEVKENSHIWAKKRKGLGVQYDETNNLLSGGGWN